MIKLKTLILEDDNLVLTKLEEDNAFNIMLKKLVPMAVVKYNLWVADRKNKNMRKKFYLTNVREMSSKIRKVERKPDRVYYDCILPHGHIEFIIGTSIDWKSGNKSVDVGYKEPAELGWTNGGGYTWYSLNDLLTGPIV
jgi:hypothetical protein